MQKDTRLKRQDFGGEQAEEYIQFRIFKVIKNFKLTILELSRATISPNFRSKMAWN